MGIPRNKGLSFDQQKSSKMRVLIHIRLFCLVTLSEPIFTQVTPDTARRRTVGKVMFGIRFQY